MWPFSQKKNELVTIALTPQNLTCSWIEKLPSQQIDYTIMAYKRVPLKQLEFSQAIPFNPTNIKHHVVSFLETHHLKSSSIALSVSGPKLFEQIITLQSASPSLNEFKVSELHRFNWNSIYLCPSQKGGFDFFVCGIQPEHLFSYQLLGQSIGVPIVKIITQQLAHLHLYKHVHGKSFRQSQLSLDLLSARYDVKQLINAHHIEQTLHINQELGLDINEEYPFLSSTFGLFLSERSI